MKQIIIKVGLVICIITYVAAMEQENIKLPGIIEKIIREGTFEEFQALIPQLEKVKNSSKLFGALCDFVDTKSQELEEALEKEESNPCRDDLIAESKKITEILKVLDAREPDRLHYDAKNDVYYRNHGLDLSALRESLISEPQE